MKHVYKTIKSENKKSEDDGCDCFLDSVDVP